MKPIDVYAASYVLKFLQDFPDEDVPQACDYCVLMVNKKESDKNSLSCAESAQVFEIVKLFKIYEDFIEINVDR